MIDRRGFLVLAAGVAAACSSRPADPAVSTRAPANTVNFAFQPVATELDLGGVTVNTWAYGDRLPGQEIRIRKGQTVRATVTNGLPDVGTTIHWHGLAIPNGMDGVPVLTQPAIEPGQSFIYEFVPPDAGTYYYHSHVGLQLDRGLYGPLIIEDPTEGTDYDDELVVVLDDWIDGVGTNVDEVFANLVKTGMPSMGDMGSNAGVTRSRPLGDDGGDVKDPYFLINGRVTTDPQVMDYRAGQRIRLRIINAGSDSAFRVGVPNHTMTVTHTDGFPVVPSQTESVILGQGERVDAMITLTSSVPLVAAAYRKDGYAQINMRVNGAASSVKVDEYVAALRNQVPLDTATLAAAPEVDLPPADPDQVIDMRLGGPGKGYVWTINGKSYDPPNDGYAVKPNQRVRIRYINKTDMFHPMHLHGVTFQVMRSGGEQGNAGRLSPAARKDTVLVAPLETVDIDFDTHNPGRWITHCHNTYHLDSGMATFIYYD